MKNIFYLFAAPVILLLACGSPVKQPLDKLIGQRDSLKTLYDSIGMQIAELEQQIAELDTAFKPSMVAVMQVTRGNFDSYFSVQGSVNCDKNALILPEIPGIVRSIFVREGDRVSEGQKLMQIDDVLIREQWQQAELNLSLARDLFARQEALWNQKIGSEVQFLQAKNNMENAEKAVEMVKTQLNKSIVTAPFSGTVDKVNVKIGEMATQMMPVLQIVDLGNMYIEADVSENYLAFVNNGSKVQVLFPGMDTIQSAVKRVSNIIKPENRTFEITVDLPSGNLIKPNLVGSVRLNDYHADSVVIIPSSIIMRDAENREFVFAAISEGELMKAKKVIIESGRAYNGQSIVLSGLSGQEMVVSQGARKLVDGQVIRTGNGTEPVAASRN